MDASTEVPAAAPEHRAGRTRRADAVFALALMAVLVLTGVGLFWDRLVA